MKKKKTIVNKHRRIKKKTDKKMGGTETDVLSFSSALLHNSLEALSISEHDPF